MPFGCTLLLEKIPDSTGGSEKKYWHKACQRNGEDQHPAVCSGGFIQDHKDLYRVCVYQKCDREVSSQATCYTTGILAMKGGFHKVKAEDREI